MLDRRVALLAGVVVTAWVPRLLTAGRGLETFDEALWLGRSSRFVDALAAGDLEGASAAQDHGLATMPGVTTMWTGALARGLWAIGHGAGLWADDGQASFASSDSGRMIAQVVMATAVALLIGLLAVLVAEWAGRRAGMVAGLLVATEPFLVAQGSVFHTDEMRELFGACSLVATALVLGLPHGHRWAHRRVVAIGAGVLFGAALLTKLSALGLLPGVAALAGWAAWRMRSVPGSVMRTMGWWVLAAAVTFVVPYPALWAHPLGELGELRNSAGLAGSGELQFFLGHTTNTPGPTFYLVVLPLRVTPWFQVAWLVATIAIWRLATRGHAWVLTATTLPYFVVLTLAAKQYARYGLLLLIVGAIAAGIVASELPTPGQLARRGRRTAVAAAAWAGIAVHTTLVAPWGLAYFNPLLGGASTARRAIEIGNGEGTEQIDDRIERLVDGHCEDVSVAGYLAVAKVICGRIVTTADQADFVLIYISERQRLGDGLSAHTAGRPLVDRVVIRGITYVEIYGPPSTARLTMEGHRFRSPQPRSRPAPPGRVEHIGETAARWSATDRADSLSELGGRRRGQR